MPTTEEEDNVRRHLQECVGCHPDDPSHHFNLGLFLWERSEGSREIKEKAAEHFVLSAKLNPQNAAAFRYLGHYYSGDSGDTQRALKCYQRAVSISPDDSISGEALCNILDEQGKDSLQFAVCREASEKSPRAFWAFQRLGYLQVHQKKWPEAAQSLQHAIRGDPTSADLWEALGLAYQRLGMFTAALKSYGRAVELENSRIFALIESGNIFLMLGSYRKIPGVMRANLPKRTSTMIALTPAPTLVEFIALARCYRSAPIKITKPNRLLSVAIRCATFLQGVEQFQQALKFCPQSISAHYGLGSGLLGLSKECTNLGAFRWGASLLTEASEVAKASTCLGGNISCLWKLYGDIQLAYAKCFPWMEEDLCIDSYEDNFNRSIVSWKMTCCAAAQSASSSYQRALHLAPWQPNIYADIAIAVDLVCSLKESVKCDIKDRALPEKMSLGGLLLESDNSEFWMALGCLSHSSALKQHAFIRGLQLDVSLAVAWAYLGKLYRNEGANQLARQAFDCSRSLDPVLALPWAGMSADALTGEPTHTINDAYESCLRAVQNMPIAEFQIGLVNLALLSRHLSSSEVFGSIRQAVQRAPQYPESHNLNGLVYESRADYSTAVASYRLARLAVRTSRSCSAKSHLRDISINLARSLCRAGNTLDAVQECEDLKREGLLNSEGMQIYAFSLWQLGRSDTALSVIRTLAAGVSSMQPVSGASSVSFICRLLYCISGQDSVVNSILKMPKEFFQSSKVSFVVSSVHALDQSNRLESVVSSSRSSVISYEEVIRMHFLIAVSKVVKHRTEDCLGYRSGVHHLRKALHIYPNSKLLRNLLGYLLLCSKEWRGTHSATKCCIIDHSDNTCKEGLASAFEVLGAGSAGCYAIGGGYQKFSFPTCREQCTDGPQALRQLQKWLRQEPWNNKARYYLILNFVQRARVERFPQHLLIILKRLIFEALSSEVHSEDNYSQYQKFQLLLCASEIHLQSRDFSGCISFAKTALTLSLPNGSLFFAHLLLGRAYAAKGDRAILQQEYRRCLQCQTDHCIGWICLMLLKLQFNLQSGSDNLEASFQECLRVSNGSQNMWSAVFDLVRGVASVCNRDFHLAEKFFTQACQLAGSESCIFMCHGVVCMELARQQYGGQFLSLAATSLIRSQEALFVPLPIVLMLLAQAEASLGSKDYWAQNLHYEWLSWPPDMRPAEIYFQMHLLAKELKAPADSSLSEERSQRPRRWILRAIHFNPSCSRYWRVLERVID